MIPAPKITQCIVIAGGLATRMKPLTETIPKSLIPIAGRPFVSYQLQLFRRQGITRVIFCIAHMGHLIREYVGDGERWGLEVDYVDEGSELLGTGGAVRLALEKHTLPDKFFVTYGDSYLPFDLTPLADFALSTSYPATMTVFRNENRWDKSNVCFSDGSISLYDKRVADPAASGMNFIDYGISVLQRTLVLNQIGLGEKADLADLFHRLSQAHQLGGFEVTDRFYEIGSVAGLEEFRRMVELARRGGIDLGEQQPLSRVGSTAKESIESPVLEVSV